MTLADIPGIIKGASDNRGLGHTFLKHIERSKILVYVIDIGGSNPIQDFKTLQNELEAYKLDLTDRPSIIIANKADLPNSQKNYDCLKLEVDPKIPIVPVSSKGKINIKIATDAMRSLLESIN